VNWKQTARKWKNWENQQFGTADIYCVLTKPSLKRNSPISLQNDGFSYEINQWITKTLVKPSVHDVTRRHVHHLSFTEQEGTRVNRQHSHGFLRIQHLEEIKQDASKADAFIEMLQDTWHWHWMFELGSHLKHLEIKATFDWVQPERSREYLLDHHDWSDKTFCCHDSRTCRRGCLFTKQPRFIGQNWSSKRH